MEARMHAMHALFRGTTQGAVAVRLTGRLDQDALRRSVRRVGQAHEILRSTILDDGGGPTLVPGAEPQLELEVRAADPDKSWLAVAQEENERPISPKQCLARLILIAPDTSTPANPNESYELILLVHHAIMDGAAADTFFHELLSLASGELAELAPRPLPLSAERLLPEKLRMGWREYTEAQRAGPRLPVPPYRRTAPMEERRTMVNAAHLEPHEVLALERRCAAHGITVNSYASGALVCAVRQHSPERAGLTLNTTFSLRRLCNASLSSDQLGCFMTVVPVVHEFSQSSVDIERTSSHHQAALGRAVMQAARHPDSHSWAELRDGLAGLGDVTRFVSDIGITFGESRLRSEYGQLQVRQLYATVNRTAGNLALVVHGTKLADRLFFTINHTAPLQDDAWAAGVGADFLTLLRAPTTSDRAHGPAATRDGLSEDSSHD
jgi:hypothetical protein